MIFSALRIVGSFLIATLLMLITFNTVFFIVKWELPRALQASLDAVTQFSPPFNNEISPFLVSQAQSLAPAALGIILSEVYGWRRWSTHVIGAALASALGTLIWRHVDWWQSSFTFEAWAANPQSVATALVVGIILPAIFGGAIGGTLYWFTSGRLAGAPARDAVLSDRAIVGAALAILVSMPIEYSVWRQVETWDLDKDRMVPMDRHLLSVPAQWGGDASQATLLVVLFVFTAYFASKRGFTGILTYATLGAMIGNVARAIIVPIIWLHDVSIGIPFSDSVSLYLVLADMVLLVSFSIAGAIGGLIVWTVVHITGGFEVRPAIYHERAD